MSYPTDRSVGACHALIVHRHPSGSANGLPGQRCGLNVHADGLCFTHWCRENLRDSGLAERIAHLGPGDGDGPTRREPVPDLVNRSVTLGHRGASQTHRVMAMRGWNLDDGTHQSRKAAE